MLTVPGIIDEEGQLHLDEQLLEKGKKAKVFVTLVKKISANKPKPKRQLGTLKAHSPIHTGRRKNSMTRWMI